jgi:hypothetical protein
MSPSDGDVNVPSRSSPAIHPCLTRGDLRDVRFVADIRIAM